MNFYKCLGKYFSEICRRIAPTYTLVNTNIYHYMNLCSVCFCYKSKHHIELTLISENLIAQQTWLRCSWNYESDEEESWKTLPFNMKIEKAIFNPNTLYTTSILRC